MVTHHHDHRGTGLSTVLGCDDDNSQTIAVFLIYCQTDPKCSQNFPSDQPPSIMLFHILNDLDSNKQHCAQKYFSQYQFTSDWLCISLFYMMQSADQYTYRTILPAVIFRLHRYNDEDVIVLNFSFRIITYQIEQRKDIHNGPAFLFSNVLNCNIVQSELWLGSNESEVDKETIIAWHTSTIMSAGNGEHLISIRFQWPKYPIDQYRDQLASYSPLLMISGQLDPTTILDQVSLLASMTAKTRIFYGIPL
ncbi:hypothetical protein I4U23_017100 [Adineta vaga]|nr:hypothetical protein I4U23_017100 [Adineta vaga]